MYKIAILVIRQDFVWISSKVAPIMCPVVLVQDETGFFLGTRSPNPIYVGSVPICKVIRIGKRVQPVTSKARQR